MGRWELSDGAAWQLGVSTGRRGQSELDEWDSAIWDLSKWDGGTEVGLSQIPSADVMSVSTRRGKGYFRAQYRAGQLRMTIRNDRGQYTRTDSPEVLLPGDYVKLTVLVVPEADIPPDTPIGDGTTWTGVTGRLWEANGTGLVLGYEQPPPPFVEALWYGRVDQTVQDFRRGRNVVDVIAYDGFADLAIIDRDAQPAAGAGETSRERIERIVESATSAVWPNALTEGSGPSLATMQATTLEGNPLVELQITAETELGQVFMHRYDQFGSPQVRYENRNWWTTRTKSATAQGRFGTGGVAVTDGRPSYEASRITNRAIIANVGGGEQTAEDSLSVQQFGPRVLKRTDLLADNDANSTAIANLIIDRLKDVQPAVRTVTMPVIDEASVTVAAVADLLDLYEVVLAATPLLEWVLATQAHIIGIAHTFTGGNWEVTYTLDQTLAEPIVALPGAFDADAYNVAYDGGGFT